MGGILGGGGGGASEGHSVMDPPPGAGTVRHSPNAEKLVISRQAKNQVSRYRIIHSPFI